MTINQLLRSSFLAGVCIGIAGFGYLASKDIIGAVLFAFGLLTVVHYALKLYTGTAGFIVKGEVGQLFLILFGNLLGCLFVALIARCSPMPLQETAQAVLSGRLATGPLKGGILAIGCGFIMTTAEPATAIRSTTLHYLWFSTLCSRCFLLYVCTRRIPIGTCCRGTNILCQHRHRQLYRV